MASGVYATTTLADAVTDLSQQLMDPSNVHWTVPELKLYLWEALRTYNALSSFYRESADFTTTTEQAFYDLPTILPTLRSQYYTTIEAIQQMCYMLLEPIPVLGVWVGTAQYSLTDLLNALQEARDEFLLRTGAVQTYAELSVPAPPADGVVDLDESIINVRRLGWKVGSGIVSTIRRDDQWGLNNYRIGWETASAALPTGYSISAQPPLQVQLAPVTNVAGMLQMVTVNRGVVLSLSGAGDFLGVPADWAWVVIYGAMKILLERDGLAFDPSRAEYCGARWQQGLTLASQAPVVLSGRISGSPCRIGSLADADAYSPSWSSFSGNPRRLLMAGQTLLGIWPPPGVKSGGGQWTVSVDVVRNAPIPELDADFLQCGAEVLEGLLAYAHHLAAFKEGTAMVKSTMGLLETFYGLTKTQVPINWASSPNRQAILDQTNQDQHVVAYAEGAGG